MERKKFWKWTTYIVNLAVALPFTGLLACGLFYLVFGLSFPATNPPAWLEITVPVVLDVLLTTLWGIYLYPVIILEKISRQDKYFSRVWMLAGIVILTLVVFFGLRILGKDVRMKHAKTKMEQIMNKNAVQQSGLQTGQYTE